MKLRIDHIFDDAESRIAGLQGVELPKGACALFVYESPVLSKYHMRGVPTDLWLSSVVGGECVESMHMMKDSASVYALSFKTACVVESRDEIPTGASVDVDGEYLVVC